MRSATARLAGRDSLVPEDIDAKKLCGRKDAIWVSERSDYVRVEATRRLA